MPRAIGAAFGLAWRSHARALIGRVLVTVLSGLAPVAAAWLLRLILDDVTSGRGHAVLTLVVVLGFVTGLSSVLTYVSQYLSAQSGRAIQHQATATLFTAVAKLTGLRKIEDPSFQDRLQRAQQAGSSGPGQVITATLTIGQTALTLFGFLLTLAALSPALAAILLLTVVPRIFAERGIARRRVAMMVNTTHAQRRQYFYASLLTDHAAAQEIRLFGLGTFFRRRMLSEMISVLRAGERVDRRELASYGGLAMLSALVAGGGLYWAALATADGRFTVGDLSVLVAALASVASGLTILISSSSMAFQALLLFRSYLEVIAEEPDLPLSPDPRPVPALEQGIELDNVWFRYGPDKPWVLQGVSFFIPAGQTVALVGGNGAGKSTLVKLLCRLYDPDRGRILWDGVDVRDLDLAGLRDKINAVFQDYMTYELSAADNVAVGDLARAQLPGALTVAAQRAGVHEVLAELPKGYDTLLTRIFYDLEDKENPQTGILLSGGQWQRLALARAFLRTGRELVILDEPSSKLDAEAEHQIHVGLQNDRIGGAALLISHRLSTVRDCDHIVVLKDGSVGEQGSHDVLMARGGSYARLFSLQARGYAAASPVPQGAAFPVGGSSG